jgi:hypothetical protein
LFRILPLSETGDTTDYRSRGIASDHQAGFSMLNLGDGTEAAWGSTEGQTDVYAGVVLLSPRAIQEVRLRLFTPGGRAHIRDIRIVSADQEGRGESEWHFVRARIKGSKEFTTRLTIPPLSDDSVVTIEVDQRDPRWRSRLIWGFACLRSQGDVPNYLPDGSGVYVRELEVE